ncbi:hypothetical protein IWQ60_005227 [Tieghemiomyces parasiticus]|uniref:Phosphodiesterase n=1 Tax=Tieghemiomyces parasiticus TaxID=78921 RepID=A0A9W8DUT3_9FUNG|nr:hypothetical protein IWQ60_005227 [Tieghemiomyces parasiticus]
MLLLKYNHLSSEDLIVVEKTMLSYLERRWPAVKLDFDAWEYSTPELYGIVLAMFSAMRVTRTLGITDSHLLDFIIDVAAGYQAVPYHSFYHSVDVVVKIFYVLDHLQGRRYLAPTDIAALLLAGLCHDVGHPGLNNLYQKHAETELARTYGDVSILEKHSCTVTRQLIAKHQLFDRIATVPVREPLATPATADAMLGAINEMILMTDMAVHYRVVEQCNSLVQLVSQALEATESSSDDESLASPPLAARLPLSASTAVANPDSLSLPNRSVTEPICSLRSFSSSDSLGGACTSLPVTFNAEQRQQFCNVVLHAVDIFNPVLPWKMCKRWSDVMIQESFRQGDLEKLHNFPITPSMDRTRSDQCQISLDFAHLIVKPFFESLAYLFPFNGFVLDSLNSNVKQWEQLRETRLVERTATAATTCAINAQAAEGVEPALAGDGVLSPFASAPTAVAVPDPRVAATGISLHGRRLSVAAGTVEIAVQHDPFRRYSGDFFGGKRSLSANWHRRNHQGRSKRRQLKSHTHLQSHQFAADHGHYHPPPPSLSAGIDPGGPAATPAALLNTTPVLGTFDCRCATSVLSPITETLSPFSPAGPGQFSAYSRAAGGADASHHHYHGSRYLPSHGENELNRQALLHAIARSRQGSTTTQLDGSPGNSGALNSLSRVKHEELINRKYRRSSSLDAAFLLRPTDDHPFVSATPSPRPCHDPTAGNVNVM